MPLNSPRLPRYDATKLARFHAFSAFCIGKSQNWDPKNSSVINFFQHWWVLVTLFQASGTQSMVIYKNTGGILKFFIFWLFMATFSPNFCRNLKNRPKLELKVAIKSQKIKIFKIPSVFLQILVKCCHKTQNGGFIGS